MKQIERFLGTWILIPEDSNYEAGGPPKKGSYSISMGGEKLIFKMIWTDAKDQNFEMEYEEQPDGMEHPYKNKRIADSMRLTSVNESILESEAIKDGQITMKATRELLDDMNLKVTLEGMLPDGQSYFNISRYKKQS